ncbi:MAG TPA: mechanosensitive ion channel family protein [bacterium]|nr:mechanosensitive ion channel family protein [bacterium]
MQKICAGNRIADYTIALLIFCTFFLAVRFFTRVILSRLSARAQRSPARIDNFLILLFQKNAPPLLYFVAFFIAVQTLAMAPFVARTVNVLGLTLVSVVIIRSLIAIAGYSIAAYVAQKGAGAEKHQSIAGIMTMVKMLVWGLGAVFVLDNLGFKISAVVTGLGIGGVAVAFASQAILGDLFSYFAIFFDRPFEAGDYIVVGDQSGTVQKIGLKTTRIASLWGEQIVFSNTDLTKSFIRNYKKMERRRVCFKFGVVYQTSAEVLKKIPDTVGEIIRAIPMTTLDRVHFTSFADSSLLFEVVYYVTGNDYNSFMDIQQEINLKVKESFEKCGIEFAYPTQKIYVAKET